MANDKGQAVQVTDKEGLRAAFAQKVEKIEVLGEFADNLAKTKKLATVGVGTLAAVAGVVGVAALAAPETGGISLGVAAPVVAGLTGMEIAAIIFAAAIGIGLIIALFKDYDEIACRPGEIVLKRKSSVN
jgi:hypothetical protein